MALVLIAVASGCGGESDDEQAVSSADPADAVTPPPPGSSPEPLPPRKTRYKPEVLGHSYSGSRSVNPPLEPTRECERIHVTYPDGEPGEELGPPVPAITARRTGDRVIVSYRFLAAPSECQPELIQAQVIPLSDSRYAASVRRARVTGLRGEIKVPAPAPGPPYAANLLTYAKPGSGSVTETRVR